MSVTDPPTTGFLLPTREHAVRGDFSLAPIIEFAERARSAGATSLWAGDSLLARPRLDPVVVLAAVAATVPGVTLGTAALSGSLRPPVTTANQLAALHHAAHGRLELAVGSGFPAPETEREFATAGVPYRERVARLDETVRLWRAAWDPASRGTFDGTFWRVAGLDGLPPPASGPPRVWLAGSDAPGVLRRVAALYDGWLPFLPTPDGYRDALGRLRREIVAAERPEQMVTPGLYATVTVDDSRAQARRELETYLHHYYGRTFDEMSRIQAYGYGTVEDCSAWLEDYRVAGARSVVVRIGSVDPNARIAETVRAVTAAHPPR